MIVDYIDKQVVNSTTINFLTHPSAQEFTFDHGAIFEGL